jgi:hypothetical protein
MRVRRIRDCLEMRLEVCFCRLLVWRAAFTAASSHGSATWVAIGCERGGSIHADQHGQPAVEVWTSGTVEGGRRTGCASDAVKGTKAPRHLSSKSTRSRNIMTVYALLPKKFVQGGNFPPCKRRTTKATGCICIVHIGLLS